MTVARVDCVDGNALEVIAFSESLVQHQLSVAGFGHRDEAVRTRMQTVDHGIDGITHKRAHLIVKVEAIAFLSIGIIGKTQMEH